MLLQLTILFIQTGLNTNRHSDRKVRLHIITYLCVIQIQIWLYYMFSTIHILLERLAKFVLDFFDIKIV